MSSAPVVLPENQGYVIDWSMICLCLQFPADLELDGMTSGSDLHAQKAYLTYWEPKNLTPGMTKMPQWKRMQQVYVMVALGPMFFCILYDRSFKGSSIDFCIRLMNAQAGLLSSNLFTASGTCHHCGAKAQQCPSGSQTDTERAEADLDVHSSGIPKVDSLAVRTSSVLP